MDKLICIIGKSGSGKTTIANELEKHGLKQIQSYTTRPKRYMDEKGHTFITREEYPKYENEIVAYTYYQDNHYFATQTQIDECDIYVVDWIGFLALKDLYEGDKEISSVYVHTTDKQRSKRMKEDNRNEKDIQDRLKGDQRDFEYVIIKCDYVVHNGELNKAIDEILSIYKKKQNMINSIEAIKAILITGTIIQNVITDQKYILCFIEKRQKYYEINNIHLINNITDDELDNNEWIIYNRK